MRMSASSSTIKMSCAMTDRAQFQGLLGGSRVCRRTNFGGGEYQPDPRSFPLCILQHQLSLMIFHDLLDDGEAQAGPLCPGRHVRLGQPLAALLRQASAVILDNGRGLAALLGDRDADAARLTPASLGDSRL